MARHEVGGRCPVTIDVSFRFLPIATPRALDEAITPGWRRIAKALSTLRLHRWIIRRRAVATGCHCHTPDDYAWFR